MRCLPKGFFRRDLAVYNSDLEFEAPLFLLHGSLEVIPLLPFSVLGLSLGGGTAEVVFSARVSPCQAGDTARTLEGAQPNRQARKSGLLNLPGIVQTPLLSRIKPTQTYF